MITIRADVSDALRGLKRLSSVKERAVEKAVQEGARILHAEVVASATGHASEKPSSGATGQFVQSLQFGQLDRLEWRVFSDAPYAQWIEYGRPPGKAPPPGALDAWVRFKLGVPVTEARSVAFLVGRKIAREGIQEKRHFRNSLQRRRVEILNEVRRAARIK